MFAKKKATKKKKGILIALKVDVTRVNKEEQRRQTLSAMGKDGQKELLRMANAHLGNKLIKPNGFWNPDGKIRGSGGSHRGHQHIRNEPRVISSHIIQSLTTLGG